MKKPDGLYIIPHGQEVAHIGRLPVRRLWGVGAHMEQALQRGGFHQIQDVARLESYHELEPYCGHQSERIYLLSKGIDERPIEWNRELQSVGNELTYERDLVDPEEIDHEWRYYARRGSKVIR